MSLMRIFFYCCSAELKSKCRTCLLFNISVVLVQAAAFGASQLGLFETPLTFNPWQLTWMLSGVVSLIGLSALSKNKTTLLNLHNIGMIMFGFGGVFFGCMAQYVAHQRFLQSGDTSRLLGIPVYLLWMGALFILFINYVLTYVYSVRLQNAWSLKKSR